MLGVCQLQSSAAPTALTLMLSVRLGTDVSCSHYDPRSVPRFKDSAVVEPNSLADKDFPEQAGDSFRKETHDVGAKGLHSSTSMVRPTLPEG
jgi:hypothetical protein